MRHWEMGALWCCSPAAWSHRIDLHGATGASLGFISTMTAGGPGVCAMLTGGSNAAAATSAEEFRGASLGRQAAMAAPSPSVRAPTDSRNAWITGAVGSSPGGIEREAPPMDEDVRSGQYVFQLVGNGISREIRAGERYRVTLGIEEGGRIVVVCDQVPELLVRENAASVELAAAVPGAARIGEDAYQQLRFDTCSGSGAEHPLDFLQTRASR